MIFLIKAININLKTSLNQSLSFFCQKASGKLTSVSGRKIIFFHIQSFKLPLMIFIRERFYIDLQTADLQDAILNMDGLILSLDNF